LTNNAPAGAISIERGGDVQVDRDAIEHRAKFPAASGLFGAGRASKEMWSEVTPIPINNPSARDGGL